MFSKHILIFALCLTAFLGNVATSSLPKRAPPAFSTFTNNAVYKPPPNYTSDKTLYARSLQLADDSILMTWENYSPEGPPVYFPIHRSTDGGATFSPLSEVHDQVNGWGLRWQPHLYLLKEKIGDFPAGTILLAGNSVPTDRSRGFLDLYASKDNARTWAFVSHIAYGAGPMDTTNGDDAVWEPFLMMHNGQMVCFYSDQRDPAHGQKLVHVTSTNLRDWSNVVNDVANPDYNDRPGMPVVAKIEATGWYILTYENCGPPNCSVFYKVSQSPLTFNSRPAIPLRSNDSPAINIYGSPFVLWTPHPQRNDGSGVIIASGSSREEVFINDDSARENGWKKVDVHMWSAYSRGMEIINVRGSKKLLFSNGGNLGRGDVNYVANGVIDIPF